MDEILAELGVTQEEYEAFQLLLLTGDSTDLAEMASEIATEMGDDIKALGLSQEELGGLELGEFLDEFGDIFGDIFDSDHSQDIGNSASHSSASGEHCY